MILSIFTTTEFYVTVLVIAAAVIAFAAMPAQRGAVKEYLLAGKIVTVDSETEPSISVECLQSGAVKLCRKGFQTCIPPAAVSLAITVKGFDVTINERITPGHIEGAPVEAEFTLDFMGQDRYHIRYISDTTSRSCTMVLNNLSGIKITRILTR